jgi:hypothetical protein
MTLAPPTYKGSPNRHPADGKHATASLEDVFLELTDDRVPATASPLPPG